MTDTADKLPAWPTIAIPRPEIRDGSFDESLFAADLGLVANGHGPDEYRDARRFCDATHLTPALRNVLVDLGRRLEGDASAPGVYRLPDRVRWRQDPHPPRRLPPVRQTRTRHRHRPRRYRRRRPSHHDPAPGPGSWSSTAPLSHRPTRPRPIPSLVTSPSALEATTPTGTIADEDRARAGTSTTALVRLLATHTPCLILLDEVLEYLNKALTVSVGDGNLAAVTLTIIKELVTAAANTPGAAVIATLTSSRMEDYATVAGTEMQERLSKVVGRAENIVTPVEGDDIFPILHRRLFETTGGPTQCRAVADAFVDYYSSLGDVLPSSYTEAATAERIAASYPFHPELVDVLTNRWGSLSGFQRTRGALRTLAHTVKALHQSAHPAPLILPGDMPLHDSGVRAEVLRLAGESYKSAMNADIIRPDSLAPQEDRRRSGVAEQRRVATRLATTAFLNSFGSDRVLGASSRTTPRRRRRAWFRARDHRGRPRRPHLAALVHALRRRPLPFHNRTEPQ